ncbi:glycosyltransferase [Gramella sp. MAR_2010_147]|uniref:glycosyltransferase n=1 Tax=Gramella sp. MAR_2010_147 TaxID=1250205 RepID=UPI0008794E0F|nr:glycosyltransferase [Gramella sp. MAR_2010_147]SDR69914.1 Glycosyltransferase involved in cell wall bisynthesis [Gramella sp. MAR_2010_147]
MTKIVSVPLIAPGFNRLRADAVWVTIANWADGFDEHYGKAEVIAGESSYSADEIRARCFSADAEKTKRKKPKRFRHTYLAKLLEMFAKDLRWYNEEQKSLSIDLERFKDAPFVWQHHDLFQTRGLKLAKKLGVPSVLFVDAPYVWESKKWGVHRLGWEWFAKRRGDAHPCEKADLILVVSEDVKRAVMDLGITESRILITPCTVSQKMFDQAKGNELRKSLGLTNNFVLGWVGSFRKFHSLDLLIEAFADVSSNIPEAKLLLVGDGPERIRLQEKVESYGLSDRVIFSGNVPHNKIHSYISSFDLAVLPSQSNEGFHYSPLKLREFFAAGVPVIASAVGDVETVITESNGGWLVPPGSKKSIVKMIKKIQGDAASINEAGLKARSYSIEEMGISKQIRMIEDYFGIQS